MVSTDILKKTIEKIKKVFNRNDLMLTVFIEFSIFIVSIAYLVSETYNPFLYFRF